MTEMSTGVYPEVAYRPQNMCLQLRYRSGRFLRTTRYGYGTSGDGGPSSRVESDRVATLVIRSS